MSVTGEDARPIDGFGHADCDLDIAEGVDIACSWNGRDLTALVGRRVRLHIKITYATLYAYRFA